MSQDPYILANPPKRQPVSGKRTYNVSIQTSVTGINKPVNSTLTYTLEIDYSDHFFTLKKTNVLVDAKVIPSKINELYLKTAEPLNTIKFCCTEQGTIKEFFKYDKLLKHWEQTKNQVKQEFTGDPVTQVIAQLDKVYNNKQILIQHLNNNIILQTFYRSFINDYLVYYGQTDTAFISTSVLSSISLPFVGKKILGLKGEQLHLQTNVNLNKAKVDITQLEAYFKNKVNTFTIDDLQISIQDDTFLDYKSVWMHKGTVTKTVQLGNYKKKIILTLQQA